MFKEVLESDSFSGRSRSSCNLGLICEQPPLLGPAPGLLVAAAPPLPGTHPGGGQGSCWGCGAAGESHRLRSEQRFMFLGTAVLSLREALRPGLSLLFCIAEQVLDKFGLLFYIPLDLLLA